MVLLLLQEPRDESRVHTLPLVRRRRGEKTRKGTGVGRGETEKSRDWKTERETWGTNEEKSVADEG